MMQLLVSNPESCFWHNIPDMSVFLAFRLKWNGHSQCQETQESVTSSRNGRDNSHVDRQSDMESPG